MDENLILLTQVNELALSPFPTAAHLAYACQKWREKFQFDTVFLAVSASPEERGSALVFDGKEELADSGLYRLGVEERLTLSKSPYKIFSDITGKPVFNKYGSLKMQKPNGGIFFSDLQPHNRFILFGLMHSEPKPYSDKLLEDLAKAWKEWRDPLNKCLDKVLESGYPSSPIKSYGVPPSNDPPVPVPVPPAKHPEKAVPAPVVQPKIEPQPVHKATAAPAAPPKSAPQPVYQPPPPPPLAPPASVNASPVGTHPGETAHQEKAVGKHRRAVLLVDEVTRLFNKEYFEESLAIEVERAKRYSRSVSLLFLEVTPLAPLDSKENEVANQVAEILSNSLRRVDVICRLDANRYGIVLPDTANHTYGIIAKRIFKYFKQIMGDQPPVYINLSASTYPQHVGNHLELYENTEKLLAQAKAAGPNKAVLPE